MTRRRRRFGLPALKNLGLLAFSGVLALLAAELVLRVVPGPHTEAVWPLLTRHDPLLGWSLTPGASGTARTSEYRVTESINSAGLRGPEFSAVKEPDEVRVLLLGDSFTEGYTVDQDETVAAVLQGRLGHRSVQVLNAGTRGWSTDQELLFFMDRSEALKPDFTVVLFYLNDVYHNTTSRSWRGYKPRYVLGEDGEIALEGVPVPPPDPPAQAVQRRGLKRAIRESLEGLAVYRLVQRTVGQFQEGPTREVVPGPWQPWSRSLDEYPDIVEGWTLTERLLARLREEAVAVDSELIVFWVPSREAIYDESWERIRAGFSLDPEQWSPTTDAQRLGEICEREALNCIIPLEEFRQAGETSDWLYYPLDGHWTAAGHELAAKLIAGEIEPHLPLGHDPPVGPSD